MDKSENHVPQSLRPEGSAAAAQREGLVGPCYVSRCAAEFLHLACKRRARACAHGRQRHCFPRSSGAPCKHEVSARSRIGLGHRGRPGAEGLTNRGRRHKRNRQARPRHAQVHRHRGNLRANHLPLRQILADRAGRGVVAIFRLAHSRAASGVIRRAITVAMAEENMQFGGETRRRGKDAEHQPMEDRLGQTTPHGGNPRI